MGVLSLGLTKYSVWMAMHKVSSVTRTNNSWRAFIVTCGHKLMAMSRLGGVFI